MAAASWFGLFTSGCRSEGPEGDAAVCGVSPGEVRHACGHGAEEPSGTVIAGPGAPGGDFLIQRTHAVFEIELAAQGDAFGGAVQFLPARSGAYGIFAGSPVTFNFEDGAGRSLPTELATSETHCAHFAMVYVVELEADVAVTLRARSAESRFRLVFERLGSSAGAVLAIECSWDAGEAGASQPSPLLDGGATVEEDAQGAPADAGEPGAELDAPSDADGEDSGAELDAGPDAETDGASGVDAGAGGSGAEIDAGLECRTDGPCVEDRECCGYCHDFDHCH